MKKGLYTLSVALAALLMSCSSSRNFAQSYPPVSEGDVTYQQFYDELSPYGNWIMYPGYGYVWAPDIMGFQPYQTNGRWVYTQMGWTWVSNYRWGWAPFHYGRWMRDGRFGWIWIPGYEWAPAWVAWRGGGGYYGWAPLGPGMSINISFGSIPYNNWYFVPNRYINSSRIDRYYVRPSRNVTIINNTTIINNYNGNSRYGNDRRNYNEGPRVMDVERQSGTRIAPVRVVNRSTPGNSQLERNQIAIYRPAVKSTPTTVSPRQFKTIPSNDLRNTPGTDNGTSFQNNGINPESREMQKRESEIRNIDNKRTFERPATTSPSNPARNTSPAIQQQNRVAPSAQADQNIIRERNQSEPVRKFAPADDRSTVPPQTMERKVREIPSPNERRVTKPEKSQIQNQRRSSAPEVKQPRVEREKQRVPERREAPVRTNKRTFKNG